MPETICRRWAGHLRRTTQVAIQRCCTEEPRESAAIQLEEIVRRVRTGDLAAGWSYSGYSVLQRVLI